MGCLAAWVIASALLTSAPVGEGPKEAAEVVTLALLGLDANKAAADAAAGMNALIASRLKESKRLRVLSDQELSNTLGVERYQQVLGACEDNACLKELSGALGARYLVTGRLDRLGGSYVLSASLFDSQRAMSVARPRAEAADQGSLAQAADRVSDQMLAVVAVQPEVPTVGQGGLGLVVGLKLGNQFLASLAALNPGAELELGWTFDPEWIAFLQLGFNLVRGQSADQQVSLTVVPTVLGARKLYRVADSLQPYWGAGMGLQLSIGQYGPISETNSFPTVIGMLGCQYRIFDELSALAEASINLAQLVLGLRERDLGLGAGFNFDLSLGLSYRF